MDMDIILNILNNFNLDGEITEIVSINSGHINDTFRVECENECYILQRINDSIFIKPYEVMENIYNVTEFLKEKIVTKNGDYKRETLNIVKTKNGQLLYHCEYGYYRMYLFVKNAVCLEKADNLEQIYESGYAFGKFTERLADFPMDKLYETIVDFHNFKVRFKKFKEVINEDKLNRLKDAKSEVDFILSRENYVNYIDDLVYNNKVPMRVVHNDAKLTNIMFDHDTNKGICILDLDTVMPGTILFDFGDSTRFGAATSVEDEPNPEKMKINIDAFREYTKGYLSACKNSITQTEKKNLLFGTKIMTYELPLRTLTDFLEGDIYFKIDYPEHNLVRAKAQIALLKDIEKNEKELQDIVMSI